VVISEYPVRLIVVTDVGCVDRITVVTDVFAEDSVTTGMERMVFRSTSSTVDVFPAVGKVTAGVDSVPRISTVNDDVVIGGMIVDWVSSSNSPVVIEKTDAVIIVGGAVVDVVFSCNSAVVEEIDVVRREVTVLTGLDVVLFVEVVVVETV
jgi:hypothetical protein